MSKTYNARIDVTNLETVLSSAPEANDSLTFTLNVYHGQDLEHRYTQFSIKNGMMLSVIGYATLEQMEALAADLLEAVRLQRELAADQQVAA
jgi:hypothetical protein